MAEKYRELSHQRREANYEDRKAKAMTGAKVLFLTCPLCGLNRPLKTYKGNTRFEVKRDYAIIQVRYGGGRGIGFFLAEDESIKLKDLMEEYPDVLGNLKEQLIALVQVFRDLNLVTRRELFPTKT
jgi:Na+-transporting NADH:ubiquinone oxidoreductase subunit NqrE